MSLNGVVIHQSSEFMGYVERSLNLMAKIETRKAYKITLEAFRDPLYSRTSYSNHSQPPELYPESYLVKKGV